MLSSAISWVRKRVVSKRVVLVDVPRYQKLERGYTRMCPGTKNRYEGTFAKTALLLRNRPVVPSRLFMAMNCQSHYREWPDWFQRLQRVRPNLWKFSSPGCLKPGCLQSLRRSALLRSFACFCVRPRLERRHLGTEDSFRVWVCSCCFREGLSVVQWGHPN